MKGQRENSALIDGILRFVVGGGAIATIIVAPGMAKVLDKPLYKYFNSLDKRARERELKRMLYYMKQKRLIQPSSEGYEHGITVTETGRNRLRSNNFDKLEIERQNKWDGKWRIVFFDIPENNRHGRRQLISKLKQLGFVQLQRSVWVHPFPCRAEIELVTMTFQVQKYVSYVEASSIDKPERLIKRFETLNLR